jgi:hypothetical protein
MSVSKSDGEEELDELLTLMRAKGVIPVVLAIDGNSLFRVSNSWKIKC